MIITSASAQKLPRPLLWLLLTLYLVPGLLGRDPWRSQDAAGFGVAHTMATGGWLDWLLPNVHGAWATEDGPLFFWIAALFIRAFTLIEADDAARLASLACVLSGFAGLWYAAFKLALRSEAVPNDPLGAAPRPVDWARAYADCALLLALATLGLIPRAHETIPELGALAAFGVWLWATAVTPEKPVKAGIFSGLAITAAFLSQGPTPALALAFASVALFLGCKPFRWVAARGLTSMLVTALLTGPIWPVAVVLLAPDYATAWWTWHLQQIDLSLNVETLQHAAKTLPWMLWPLWPLMLSAFWYQRQRRASAQLFVPLVLTVFTSGFNLLASGGRDESWTALVLPAALMATPGILTLRRSVSSLIDWYAVLFFSFAAALFWLYWLAFETGSPVRFAQRIPRLFPELNAHASVLQVVIGAGVTILWLSLIRWRVARGQPRLWRPVALSAGGLTLIWALLMTLWLPAGDASKSYRGVAQQLSAAVLKAGGGCLSTHRLNPAPRASFAYFGRLKFARAQDTCRLMLIQDAQNQSFNPGPDWLLIWEGRRAVDRKEREQFRLYRSVKEAGH